MSKAYQNFIEALDQKSTFTKEVYLACLKNFCEFLQIRNCDRIVEIEVKKLEDLIKDFVRSLVATGKGYSSQNQHVSALKMFFVSNRVNLNFSWIFMALKKDNPEDKVKDRPHRKPEIARLLKKADLRGKVELGIMFAGGARVGALPGIKIPHLHYVDEYNLYAIDAYPNDKEANYWILVTPQVSAWIKELVGNRKEGFLLRSKNDNKSGITRDAIVYEVFQLTLAAGLREPGKDTERQDVMLCHGLRKFFRTTLETSKIKDEHAERLLGHIAKLKRIYSKPTPLEVVETTEYQKAIPNLTIDLK